ncbi:MAG: ABC transporter permease [Acidobacteriota bacterium]|nr:ABC transporter permease [Acidobacteriota bacterium]
MHPVLQSELSYPVAPAGENPGAAVETVIDAGEHWFSLKLRDLWNYRELLGFLVWRDVKVRYKQTALGAAWAVLQPLLAMLVFTLLFGRLAKLPSDNIPYPLFVYTALLPWQLFAFALTESSNSLVANQHLIRKVYFPRLVIPVSAVLVGLVDFAISLVVLVGMMIYYGFRPAATALLFIPFLVLAVLTALGIGFWLSALNIKYRDVKYVIPFVTQFWMFATPVAYSSKLVPPAWRTLYGLNPMTGVVDGFRWALLGSGSGSSAMILISIAAVLCVLAGGVLYFKRMERTFADMV